MIKLFLFDIDGVLTDGSYYIYNDEKCKRYHTRDFHGLNLLHQKGILIGAISSDSCSTDQKQFKRAANFVKIHQGITNKKEFAQNYYNIDNYNNDNIYPIIGMIKMNEVAYIGDDLLDIELLKSVGFAACPHDAEEEVIKTILKHNNGMVLDKPGGNACIREFINLIIKGEKMFIKKRNNSILDLFDFDFFDMKRPIGYSLDNTKFAEDNKILVADIIENEDNFLIKLEVPGAKETSIKVNYSLDTLTVFCEYGENKEESKNNYHRSECMKGSYQRHFYLPDTDENNIKATLANGILQVICPKIKTKVEIKSKEIPV